MHLSLFHEGDCRRQWKPSAFRYFPWRSSSSTSVLNHPREEQSITTRLLFVFLRWIEEGFFSTRDLQDQAYCLRVSCITATVCVYYLRVTAYLRRQSESASFFLFRQFSTFTSKLWSPIRNVLPWGVDVLEKLQMPRSKITHEPTLFFYSIDHSFVARCRGRSDVFTVEKLHLDLRMLIKVNFHVTPYAFIGTSPWKNKVKIKIYKHSERFTASE